MAQNFPNLMKNINLHVQEAQQSPSKINAKIHHNQTVKSNRQEELKRTREKQFIIHKGSSIRLITDFSSETIEVRRQNLPTKNSISGKTIPENEG